MRVPAFLVRRFYVDGSLRNTPDGFELQAHNDMSDGMLVGVRSIQIDAQDVALDAITASRDGVDDPIRAADISRLAPVPIRRGERVTLRVEGWHLPPGQHHLEVEIIERDLGALQLGIDETVMEDVSDDAAAASMQAP
ncbi:MAG: hypothetical protein ABIZ34_02520 [Candidatus Limnocylindrales bacterium]